MITLTKEWLQQTIAELEEERDALPGAVNEDAAMALAAMKLALASLEAEPEYIRYDCGCCGWETLTEWRDNDVCPKCNHKPLGTTELHTAPPAAVSVPDDVSGPLAHAYKELTPTFMRNHIDVFERYGIYPDGSAGIQAMRIALDGMTRRAAMLQGAERVTTANRLPDGWVACSERMPGSQEWVIVFAKWANQQVLCWDDVANRWTDFEDQSYFPDMFSHWMPLPAAPKQEVK